MPPRNRLTRRPTLLRVGALVAALVAGAVAIMAIPSAGASTPRRERIVTGDTVRGDVLFPGDFDEYLFDAPRGTRVMVSFRRLAPGGWKPYMGVLGETYSPSYGGYLFPSKLILDRPLDDSGMHRLIVSGAGGTFGAYQVALKLAPGRSFTAPAANDATPETLTFGAVAGATISVVVTWKGTGPVTLASLTGPDGPLTSAVAPRTGPRSSRQTGFTTTALGDHTATFAVPAGVTTWSARVSVTTPKPARGTVRDFRTVGAPPPVTLSFIPGGEVLGIAVVGERGGPNDFFVAPKPGANSDLALGVVDLRASGCSIGTLEVVTPPGSYILRCANGWSADVAAVERSGEPPTGPITAVGPIAMRSPYGTGTLSVTDISYDTAGRPATWTETRTYDATGHTHVIRVLALTRVPDGRIFAVTAEHEGPDGVRRTIDYSPVAFSGN